MTQHARVMPSNLHLTVACPGSLQLQEQVSAEIKKCLKNGDELEGQAAHVVAMGVASKRWEPKAGDKFLHEGLPYEIDDDMLDGALMYAEEAQFHSTARYEDSVDMRQIIPECWGTPDYWRVIDSGNGLLAKIVDYKYGFRHVEVFENPQLTAYALGVQQRCQLPWETPVCLTIVQPRAFHSEGPVREWRSIDGRPLTLADLYYFTQRTAVPAVTEALSPSPRTISGPHCVDCTARAMCVTYRKSNANILQYVGSTQPETMTPLAVGVELRLVKQAMKMLEGRETGLRAYAESCINAGQQIPYWRMGAGQSRRKWKDDVTPETIATVGDMVGVDLRKPMSVITPRQAEQKGVDARIVAEYAHRPSGAPKLIPDDETQFRKLFSK